MSNKAYDIKTILKENGLKITPQRIAVLDAINSMKCHPTAETIIEYIRQIHPNIATGTVYKVLDILVERQIIRRVKTDKDIMRYDGLTEKHHHLYCAKSDRIEDYIDKELDEMIKTYFEKNKITGFKIQDIKLQITGQFTNKNETN